MEKVPLVGGAFKVTPASTPPNCVVSLTIQYSVIYTALAPGRTAADVWNLKYDDVPIQKILQTAATFDSRNSRRFAKFSIAKLSPI